MCRALNCSQQSRSATLHEQGLPGGPRRINQNFDIEGLEPSISVYDLTFDIEDSSISIYEFELRYRRIFYIEYYLYRKQKLRYRRIFDIGCFDIEVLTFDIEVSSFLCASISKHADFDIEVQTFDIEVTYRTRYRS
jgi:hypothetical protein